MYTAPVNGTLAINTKIGKNKTFYVIAEDGTKVAEVKMELLEVHIILLRQK